MKVVYYWSPFLTKIATIKSVYNSAISLTKYSEKYKAIIINVCGEWNEEKKILEANSISCIDLVSFNYHKYLPKRGYFFSRFSLFVIVLISFIPLIILLLKKKPNFFIIHLNSILPIFFSNFFFNTKFILRISGFPKLHFLRKFLWKSFSKNLFKVISPTFGTKEILIRNKIFRPKDVEVIRDPVLVLKNIKSFKKSESKQLLAIGRLTRQKNFHFLIKCFYQLNLLYPNEYKLVILGEGEDKKKLENLISILKLEKQVKLLGYKKNIEDYFSNSCCFVLSSLWEDPGFVLIESSIYETVIISSNCESGPKELIEDNDNGLLYENNNVDDFVRVFNKFRILSEEKKKLMKINSKKSIRKYTLFFHGKALEALLNN